jgi:hypothetical protein
MSVERVYWHQAQGGSWHITAVAPGSIVAHQLANREPGQVVRDEYGNAYRYELVEVSA